MEITERIIIEQLKRGNEEAYKYLYRHHYALLCHIAHEYVGDDFLAETLVGDVVFHLWEVHETLDIQVSLRSYLVRAVRNHCMDYLSSKKERTEVAFSSIPEEGEMRYLLSDDYPLGSLLEHELEEEIHTFEKVFEKLKIQTLLSGEYDACNAIMTIHAGAGGTESCDWAGMLYRMYCRWAERKGFSLQVLDFLDGDIAGIKAVTFEVKGENAYGYLKSEKGVHRLVRISPFNSAGKRQTSFASCDVLPDLEDDIDIEIDEDDLKIDTYRASGAGGQHVNKTSSAIRITHLPTGIVVQCQNERSQHHNKEKAMQMLKAKLQLMKEQEQAEKVSDIRGEVKDIGFGNQIRSYVMQPYTLVKDHRTNEENSNVNAVMDGDIDSFINAYLKKIANG